MGKRELTQPLASGRIYKVMPKNRKTENVTLQGNPEQLVRLLGHANGWVRDKAQQKLIDMKSTQVIPLLQAAIAQKENPLFALHALWTLEGLNALKTEEVLAFINNPTWTYKMQGLTAVPSVISQENYAKFTNVLDLLISSGDTLAAPYVAFLAPSIKKFDGAASTNLLKKLSLAYPDNRFVADAIVSNLQDDEEPFLAGLTSSFKTQEPLIAKQLQKAIANAKSAAANRNPEILKKQFPKGEALFTSICQTCHGIDGNGVKSLGPPLNQSEWVTGSREKLISIVLFGLTGPVKVNGHVYQAPEISGDMPGIGYDPDMQSEDIAQLLSYIRKSWRNNSDQISTDEVVKVRKKLTGRQKAFTESELNNI
jgi:mono/diheme cytochrome c family protein